MSIADRGRFLVVGADSQIGAGLVACLNKAGATVRGTTRRNEKLTADSIFLDLARPEELHVVEGAYACAFLCAGITAMSACEDGPERAYRVNVTNTLRLARRLHAAGARIVFLSSNAVFNGKSARPDEDAGYCPSTEYGRQKAAVERELMALPGGAGSLAVVRLSKVLSPVSDMAGEFIGKLADGAPCTAFDDLLMSPVSLQYVVDALANIACSDLSGIFHLSGAEEMSYAEFARSLAVRIGADPDLVRPCHCADAGAKLWFRPEHPALGMKRTGELLGIEAEPAAHLLDRLVVGNG